MLGERRHEHLLPGMSVSEALEAYKDILGETKEMVAFEIEYYDTL